ncbi:hypothetical protein [Yersinia aldovae]|uniref:hypothetical protein n=1 Tax=Yersinia aldovae TaxID=29483 RepID=UPI0005ACB6B0|nr:hypothetical protein [Yersinia aldovae]AJJ62579.1 putative lipoprotein [Yersinia aldovae 670-83]
MNKIILSLMFLVTGCSTSAYDSGWNDKTSFNVFHECARSSVAPSFYYDQNVERLVPMGLLTQEEASRAKKHDVRIGDKECLAYASYGFNTVRYNFSRNTKDLLVRRSVEYRCEKSPIQCPGQKITITDGKVSGIESLEQ